MSCAALLAVVDGDLVPLALTSLFVIVGVVFVVGGLLHLLLSVRMWRLEPSDAGTVGGGTVELTGEVAAAETVAAPLTGAECVTYEVVVDRLRDGQRSDADRRLEETGSAPFHLADATGTVGVDPEGAELSLDTHHESVAVPGEEPSERVASFASDRPELHDGGGDGDPGVLTVAFGDRHRFVERRLEPGSDAYVLGVADATVTVAAEQPSVRDASGDRVLADYLSAPFVVSDAGETATQRRFFAPGLQALLFGFVFAAGGAGMMALIVIAWSISPRRPRAPAARRRWRPGRRLRRPSRPLPSCSGRRWRRPPRECA
jgi:hypothetical protein